MSQFRSTIRGCAVCAMFVANAAFGAAVVAGFNSTIFPANDDEFVANVPISFAVNFFGTNYTQLAVNNNGNVTFNGGLNTFTPFSLVGNTGNPIIAPFFADVDTRGAGSALTRYGTGTFNGNTAFGVTWDGVGVGYFNQHVDKLNKFQLLLVNRTDTGAGNFDIYFNYDQIQWETGDASNGVNGFGGTSAHAGYSNGSGVAGTSFEIAGSGVNGALLDGGPNSLVTGGNTGVAGRFLFEVRNGTVINPPPPSGSTPDAGSSLGLLALGILSVVALRRKLS